MSKSKEEEFIERLSEQEICELHEAFNIFDVESDGSIGAKQLKLLMNALKQYPTQNEIDKILSEFNIDINGQIYFNQFLKIMAKRLKNIKEDEDKYLKSLFSSLDRNNNGLISIHEIRYIVTHSNENISQNDIEIIMKEADTDGDGLISFEEFMTIMKN
jgi:calmodulin